MCPANAQCTCRQKLTFSAHLDSRYHSNGGAHTPKARQECMTRFTTVPLSYTLVQEYFPSLGSAKTQLHALAGSLQGCTPRLEKHTAIFSGWVVGEKNAMYAASCQTELKHQIKTLAARTSRLQQDMQDNKRTECQHIQLANAPGHI